MKPLLAAWLVVHGVPAWAAPSYATMVGLAGLIGAAIVLRFAARDGGDVRGTAMTLLLGYGAALGGGYLYELLRAIAAAITELSLEPFMHVGRAAYGGLVFGTLATAVHLKHRRAALGPFFDRVALALGPVFALVRTGCLLEGCDYGVPTTSALGVSYPPGALAALDHVHRGWVSIGASSLPTHPTQLYEGAVALIASALAVGVHGRTRQGLAPRGSAFLGWVVVYAIGRAWVETLRADADRGLYAGVSTAQWTSLVVGAAALCAWMALRAPARANGAASAG